MFLSVKKFFIASMLPCFFLSGCGAPQQVKIEQNQEKPAPAPIENGVWQTDDVDLSHLHPQKKLVALTFDDAPTNKLDALLEVFIEFNKSYPDCPASATLFCNGSTLSARKKESLYTAFALGFELGNHTFSHRNLISLPSSEIEKEIKLVDDILQEIDGKPMHLFRAPYGNVNDQVLAAVKTPVINWYIDTRDWSTRSASALENAVFERLQEGAIILMHDGYESTVEGVKKLLPVLKEAGYQAVTVSQLVKAHRCQLKVGKVYTRARKQKA